MNLRKYINIPYKHLGRDFTGVDCFGLCWLVLKEERGILLPDTEMYSRYWYKEGQDKINPKLDELRSIYTDVDSSYNLLDILLFYSNANKKVVSHMGIYVGDNKFLHSYSSTASLISRLEGAYKDRLYKAVRVTNQKTGV